MRIHHIVTDLCVMDFGGPDHAIRVISLHPGVSFEQVQAATGFPLLKADDLRETTHPTDEQLAVIRKLDPKDVRSKQLKGKDRKRTRVNYSHYCAYRMPPSA